MTDGWGISCEIALIWMSLDLTDDQSTLVQVMAWCHQATSHYLSQCWPRSLSPYGVTRPQWVNIIYKFMQILVPIAVLFCYYNEARQRATGESGRSVSLFTSYDNSTLGLTIYKIHLGPKYHKILSVCSYFLICPITLKFCTQHGSIIALMCVKF